jgi:phosphoglycerate kinase
MDQLVILKLRSFHKVLKKMCEIIASTKAYSIVGGGDTARAVVEMGYQDKMSHISTGGGASLTFVEGTKLPALEIINEKK